MVLNMRKILGVLFVLLFSASIVCAKDLRFIQVSEAKYCVHNDYNQLDKIIKDINKQKNIDFVIFTGDNIERPTQENLLAFTSAVKKIKAPCYVVIGDKDVNKHKDLSKKQYAKFLKRHLRNYKHSTPNYIFEKQGMVFMVVDGANDVIPSSNGFYKDDVLEWVDANLDLYAKKPVIIFQHFPLVNRDLLGLLGEEKLATELWRSVR